METKTCGECKYFVTSEYLDVCVVNCETRRAGSICTHCGEFKPKVVTNGDVIRRGGDKALLVYRSNAACYYCSFRDTESCKSDFSNCKDGQLAWLNAPAESEVNNEADR